MLAAPNSFAAGFDSDHLDRIICQKRMKKTNGVAAAPDTRDEQIRQTMAGTLCRCMTYYRIQAAIKRVAGRNS